MNATQVQHDHNDGIHVVSFPLNDRGQANADVVRRFFATEFLDSTKDCERLVVDLSGVLTLDSASLGPLVQRLRDLQAKQGTMALCGVRSAGLREIFALTRFDKIFPILPSREEAVKKAKG
ncbi:MAG: STAS domain-containing protein [Planctomycetota bacterium]|jgi:anti-anti-sigma factor|nr:STAS domain-containing protein [Planctomycetota bacterium]